MRYREYLMFFVFKNLFTNCSLGILYSNNNVARSHFIFNEFECDIKKIWYFFNLLTIESLFPIQASARYHHHLSMCINGYAHIHRHKPVWRSLFESRSSNTSQLAEARCRGSRYVRAILFTKFLGKLIKNKP